MFIQRDIEKVLMEAYSCFPVLTIVGPRQSGKTTLIKNLFKTLPYFSLEDLDVRRMAEEDPRGFLSQSPQGAILDEIQNVPDLLSYIQGIVDANEDVHYILSGSSQFSMMKSVSQSLAGRTGVFELLPFSYPEIQNLAETKSIDELIVDGFYPAIYSGRNNRRFLYQSYVKTYLERDVRQLLNVGNIDAFQKFIRLCATRIGSLFNASDLSNEIGVSSKTIKSWLSVLQASYVVVLLQPFYENIDKRLTKTPKLYFVDTGLACYLLGIETVEQLGRDRARGHLFENFIIMEALKHRYNQAKDNNLFFYRDSNQNEVDLVLKNENGLNAIEVKSSQTYSPEFEKGIKTFCSVVKQDIKTKAIIYTGEIENTSREIQLVNYKNIGSLFG
jgi:hypothetical protein